MRKEEDGGRIFTQLSIPKRDITEDRQGRKWEGKKKKEKCPPYIIHKTITSNAN